MNKKLTFDDIRGNDGVKEQARSVVDVLVRAQRAHEEDYEPCRQRLDSLPSVRAVITGSAESSKLLLRVITDQADILVKYLIRCTKGTTERELMAFIRQARIAPRSILILEQPENLNYIASQIVEIETNRWEAKPFHLVTFSQKPNEIEITLRRRLDVVIELTE